MFINLPVQLVPAAHGPGAVVHELQLHVVQRDDAADSGPVPEVVLAPHGGNPVSDQEKVARRNLEIF